MFCLFHGFLLSLLTTASYMLRVEKELLFSAVLTLLCSRPTVPLRAPELSLTSHSPTDIQVSWQPLPEKLSRGRVSAYSLSYRSSDDSTASQVELSGDKTQHLLENLQPDTIYLLRIAAATSVGWGEQSVWTSHRTPKASRARGRTFRGIIFRVWDVWDITINQHTFLNGLRISNC